MPKSATPTAPRRLEKPPAGTQTAPPARKTAAALAARFPIVGIGASAGGLEALGAFLDHAPTASGAAFVIVQHLDPGHAGMMPELLQRHTAMPVREAGNRQKVRPDHVYVIPRNKDLSILHGTLHLLEPVERRGRRLPIDFFFRALAADCRDHAVGVLLSGMGSDGTLGLRAIKENAGLALVQEPESAAFGSMPMSAIDAGLADIIARPEELPARIDAYFKNTPPHPPARAATALEAKAQGALETILVLLRERTGNDFSLYKKSTLYRRIERRMDLHQIDSIAAYAHYLREVPEELETLFNELLIGVTSFFRDPVAWSALIEKALPILGSAHPPGTPLRAWVPGCSTGEEAYSLAIAFREAMERVTAPQRRTLQIFATDLDQAAVEQARAGLYLSNIAADVSRERLASYFVKQGQGYRVRKDVREMLIFARQNVIMDPPFTRLDILSCRNLLIYLSPELQQKLLRIFHYALNHHGILMLGSAETVGAAARLFAPIDAQASIYRRIECPQALLEIEFPTRSEPAVMQSAQAAPRARHDEVGTAARRAGKAPRRRHAAGATLRNGAVPDGLEPARDELQRLRDETQVSQEELRSSNEELQTTNEELQSINAELSSSKEEMQSLNEELQTVNAELEAKVAEMSSVSSDMENLLNSTETSTVFLDRRLDIRRFTPYAQQLFKLLPVDVGRPLSDIVSQLDYPDLLQDAGEVLRTLVSSEKPVRAHDGRRFVARITPYRGGENLIDGVVITFTDVSELHALKTGLEEGLRILQNALDATTAAAERESILQAARRLRQAMPVPGTAGMAAAP